MADVKSKESQVRASINQKLIETGEKESVGGEESRFGFPLIKRSEIVKTKGLDNITAEDLVAEITPTGRAQVPAEVKQELLQRIRQFLQQYATGNAPAT